MQKTKIGTIDISELTNPPEKHELAAARIFSSHGHDIKFIRPSNIKGNHRPDFIMDGKAWELKSPTGSSIRTIENNFRKALLQSENVIFDLSRIKLNEDLCIHQIAKKKNEAKRKIGKIYVIKKNGEVIDI